MLFRFKITHFEIFKEKLNWLDNFKTGEKIIIYT